MHLPASLQRAIDEAIESVGFKQLVEAREKLTKRYREKTSNQYMTTKEERLSYLTTRMPATFAALCNALEAIKERSDLPIKSLVDLGSGPGTALWAFLEYFPEIEKLTPIEIDAELSQMGKKLGSYSEHKALQEAVWQRENLEELQEIPEADAIVFSYSIGELKNEKITSLIERALHAAKHLLLIVEPGTPAGFERIRFIRQLLIEKGAFLIAPCPHHNECPMKGGNWCHFPARVERSKLHRRIKGGALGYEDEKFSYVAAVKSSVPLEARILANPGIHSGHVNLTLCTDQGLKDITVSKKSGELYKRARKSEWGDAFPYTAKS